MAETSAPSVFTLLQMVEFEPKFTHLELKDFVFSLPVSGGITEVLKKRVSGVSPAALLFICHTRECFSHPSLYSWVKGMSIISGGIIHDSTVGSYCFIREANYASGKYAGPTTFHLDLEFFSLLDSIFFDVLTLLPFFGRGYSFLDK